MKIVVFDKTGTLTAGKPTVVSAKIFSKFSMEEFCNVVIAVEVCFLCNESFFFLLKELARVDSLVG